MTREQFISCVEGSQRAFRRFLTALCCGDSFLADDIAQESYLKAFMAVDSLRSPDKFKSWIYSIGYNTFMSHRRAERPCDDIDSRHNIAAPDSADAGFRYQALYAALDRLPAKERTSVLLFYMENYSVKEISAMVDASECALRQHLSRGREHLRGLLKKE